MAGDANGQCNLGACYEHGLGCVHSYAKAVKWYRLSVAQGLATAAMNLGYCYLRGHGVPRDEVEALRLFRLAVAGGEERAQPEVERLEMSRGPRGLQIVPEDTPVAAMPDGCSASPASTQQARPCVLALGSLPRDGSPERLQPPGTAQVCTVNETRPSENAACEPLNPAPHLIAHEADDPEATVSTSGSVAFVDETQPGRHFGLVGSGGVERPRPAPWEDEDLRRELLDVLKFGATDTDSESEPDTGEATDEELFPIYAESGMVPEDFVPETAERYAQYLKARGKS
jgi:TPR repeat protein